MVSVEARGGETCLRVESRLGVESWPRVLAVSSESRVPNIPLDSDRWPDGLAWSVRDRIRNGGDAKGRAIAIWQISKTKDPGVLAVLTWHREERGPFYVLDLGARTDLGKEVRRVFELRLLEFLLEASRKPDANVAKEWQSTLRWATAHFKHAPHSEREAFVRAAIKRARRRGFERYAPPPQPPSSLRGSWLGERDFNQT